MEFQKIDTFFGETCSWDFSATSCHTSTFIDIANIFLANKRSVKTICTVSGSNSSHMDVTCPMNFEKNWGIFLQNRAPGILRQPFAIQALLWTLQTFSWLTDVPQRPYSRFQGATKPMWMSLVP